MVVVVYDVEWFNVNQGLCNEGLCLVYLSNAHTTFIEVCFYFGPKFEQKWLEIQIVCKTNNYIDPKIMA
jgi:hypothetical protein